MKKVKETGKKQAVKIYLQMFAMLMLLLPTIMSYAQYVKIPDGWFDGYAYVNGIRVHYYHAKPAPGKPAMVMVHGVTDIGLSWTTLTLKLQDSYDIYMVDTRGHGLSDPFTPADNGETLIKDVVDFVHVMKLEKPILMGHSMGAATVMRVGAEYPDLAKAIIMLDPFVGRRPFRPSPQVRDSTHNNQTTPVRQTATSPDHLSVSMFGNPETLVAQNNYKLEDLFSTGRRQFPKWDSLDVYYWAVSKKTISWSIYKRRSAGNDGNNEYGRRTGKDPGACAYTESRCATRSSQTERGSCTGNEERKTYTYRWSSS